MTFTFYKIKAALCLSAITLSACATTGPALGDHSATFGGATAQNITAQAVAPTPAQKANTFIPADRARQQLARDNYRNDTVKKPQPLSTIDE